MCSEEWDQWQDISNTTKIITNIFVFLDTTWAYQFVVDYISYVLERLNINPYASSITLFAAANGNVMVNTTNYLNELFMNWNQTTHSWYQQGFNLPTIFNVVRDRVELIMEADRNSSSMGGQSLIALLIPSPVAFVADWDYSYCMRYLHYLNYTTPDLHFIYYGGGALIRFKDFVNYPADDLYPLSYDLFVHEAGNPVVKRLRRVPRRIVNPRCGADWYSTSTGNNQMLQYVRLGAINFYRMAPNYFYGSVSMRYLRIQAVSAISFTVCTSRTIALPFLNGSQHPAGQECGQVTSQPFSIDLTDECFGERRVGHCAPLFFSVQAQDFADVTQVSCKQPACQYPDQAQFLIYANNLVCNVGGRTAVQLTAVNLIAVLLTAFIVKRLM